MNAITWLCLILIFGNAWSTTYDDDYGYDDGFVEHEPSNEEKRKMDEAYEKIKGKTPFFPSNRKTCHAYPGPVNPCTECAAYLYLVLEYLPENDQAQLRMMETAVSILLRYYKNPLIKMALIEVDPAEHRREFGVSFLPKGFDYGNKFKHTYTTNLSSAFGLARKRYLGEIIKEQADLLIMLSDGFVNDHDAAVVEADLALKEGIQIFAVEIGQNTEFQKLADFTQDRQRTFPRGEGTGPQVEKQIKGLVCATCCKYQTYTCPCEEPLDFQVLLDSSDALGEEAFLEGRDFLRSFVPMFLVSNFGVGVYAKKLNNIINITAKPTVPEIDRLLRSAPFMKGPADTATALLAIQKKNKWTVVEPTAKNLLILTKGKSSDPKLTGEAADEMKRAFVHTYAVGIDTENTWELHKLAPLPGRYKQLKHAALQDSLCEIVEMVCKPNHIPPLPECGIDIDVIFVVDEALPQESYVAAKWVARQLILGIEVSRPPTVTQRTAVVSYGPPMTEITLLNNNYSLFKTDRLIRISGEARTEVTDMGIIIRKARNEYAYPKHRGSFQSLVIFTNGANQDINNVRIEAQMAHSNSINIVVVKMGKDENEDVIKAIVEEPSNIMRYTECNPTEDPSAIGCVKKLLALVCRNKCPESICRVDTCKKLKLASWILHSPTTGHCQPFPGSPS